MGGIAMELALREIVISWKNEKYEKNSDIRKLLGYIAGEGSHKEKEYSITGARGLSLNEKEAAKQVIKLQEKLNKRGKRRIAHVIVSFPRRIQNVELVHGIAEDIADYLFEKYQVFYGVHTSEDNLHVHFAINRVSYVDGLKMHLDMKEFRNVLDAFRKIAVESCEKSI